MLSILVRVFPSCNMHGATLRAKRGSILCATAQKVMRNGPVALTALSLHLSFSGWPYSPTCHTPGMQYVLCANELGVRKTMYFTLLDSINLMRDCSGVKLAFSKTCVLPSSAPKMLCASPVFVFYGYARLQRYYKSCLLAVELLLVTILYTWRWVIK